jgi:hypothetical protein
MTKETGGPAFPSASIKTKEGIDVWGEGGMTLRDYFAAKAMQSLMWDKDLNLDNRSDVAEVAYAYADEMMEARNA